MALNMEIAELMQKSYDDGVTDLSSFIENLLIEKLFTDKIVNTLIALLLPMVCDLLETKINELLSDLVIEGVHCSTTPHSGWSAGLVIQNILNGAGMGVDENKGRGKREEGRDSIRNQKPYEPATAAHVKNPKAFFSVPLCLCV